MIASHELLAKAHLRQKKNNQSYSLRSLARQLNFSPSFLSDIFKGKKPLPPRHLSRIAKFLNLDEIALEKLKGAMLREKMPVELKSKLRRQKNVIAKIPHEEMANPQFNLLSHWYLLPLLDLTTCEDFSSSPAWIAGRLGISEIQARQAWDLLRSTGCVKKENGRWLKWSEHIRFPTRRSDPAVRNYHGQTLALARAELNKTSEEDFAKRLISGLSVAVNPAKVAEAKLRLQEALLEVSKVLSEGKCSEVYQLQVQLFPVTKGDSK